MGRRHPGAAGALQRERNRKGEFPGELREDLRGREGRGFLRVDGGESLLELGVAVLLTGLSRGEGLLRGGELRRELRAVAAVFAPGKEENGRKHGGEDNFSETDGTMKDHR